MLSSEENRQVESHLAACESCRHEAARMREHSELIRSLRPSADIEPAPGFYARVMDRVESLKSPSIWSTLLEPVFAKRLAVVSLALLVLLGAMVASVDRDQNVAEVAPPDQGAIEQIVEDVPAPVFGINPERDREVVLVNLATYQY
jgi:anti-sigma factor RsiW